MDIDSKPHETPGRVVSLNISPGGVPKLPVQEAQVTQLGLVGDKQAHRQIHGGPHRAVCLFPLELIEQFRRQGHPIVPGAIGENVTVQGLDWSLVRPGATLAIGPVELSVTRYTAPCNQIRAAFADGDYRRVNEDLAPGQARVYARVLREGSVKVGDEVRIIKPAPSEQ